MNREKASIRRTKSFFEIGDEVRCKQDVMDTGGKMSLHIIVIWLPTCEEAVEFGRQDVKVRVRKLGELRR